MTKIRKRARLFLTFAIKACYDPRNEDDTRLNIRRQIKHFYDENDDYELRAVASKMLNEMSFDEIEQIYKSEIEEKDMSKENETVLFDTVIKGKDGETVTVYLNGDEDEEMSCKKIKAFRFEESFYVLLQDLKDNASKYYRYVYETQDGKPVEKLIRVNDDQQVSLFKFLGY